MDSVAILAAAGRFPGARDLDAYWQNLIAGTESIHRFGADDLRTSGLAPAVWQHPDFVAAAGAAPDVDLFDAEFFGLSGGEARLLCPQHRVFLEHAWEVLERAGYDSHRFGGRIGVFAGSNASTYLIFNILSHPGLIDVVGHGQTLLATDKDYVATRASYALDLRGPSVTVNSACSTSLVAVHMACQSLLAGECDLAIAGAVTVHTPPGYLHQEGLPLSPDGRCRPFDAAAQGSGVGSGAGVVVLKLLDQALADRDQIVAVIRGSAVNNDGGAKVSYTAPSTRGEETVITEALAIAGVSARDIGYVEAHGTGTLLGDPIEVEALSRVFQAAGVERGGCALGSVKSNFGHLGAAAGMAGLIKTILALRHRQIPPSVNFTTPNPRLNLEQTPFHIVTSPEPWSGEGPLRAGVSSFGVGGTNSHVVLEEAPAPTTSRPHRSSRSELLLLSARTSTALDATTARLAGHLETHPDVALADVSFTLGVGRREFRRRSAIVARDNADAVAVLSGREPSRLLTAVAETRRRPIALLFPGGGSQHAGMARSLYESEPTFRTAFDRCREALRPLLGVDIGDIVVPSSREAADRLFERAATGAASILAVSWSLAELWKSFGVVPDAVAGYSTGEYTAAAVAGVMTVEEALRLLVERLDLIDERVSSPGGMLSVPLGAEACTPYLSSDISLAGANGPRLSVLSGARPALDDLDRRLRAAGIDGQFLRVPKGYHSVHLDPIVPTLERLMRTRTFRRPTMTWISTVTGLAIGGDEATDPMYWVRNCLQTVRFGDALEVLLADADRVLLEAGPGVQMATLARQQAGLRPTHLVLSSMSHPRDTVADRESLLGAAARLWLAGQPLAPGVWRGDARRVALPTYPFARRRHWIDPKPSDVAETDAFAVLVDEPSMVSDVIETARTIATPYVAARNDFERVLVDLWERTLGTRPVGVHDDFFELGGNSLLGIQLFGQFPSALRQRLKLTDLMMCRTIADLAARAHRQEGSASPLVQLRGGDGPPIFCPHALLGGALSVYQPLVAHLPPGRPLYGFVAAGLDGREPPRDSIDAMAAAYIAQMKDVQPRGPYSLMGFSAGGLIAFEIARQLRAGGDAVDSLVLLDARATAEFSAGVPEQRDDAVLEDWLQHHVNPLLPEGLCAADITPIMNVARAMAAAVFAYEPQPFDGAVLFLTPTGDDNPFGYPETPPEAYWTSRTARLEVVRVPGGHYSMMVEPHVGTVAGALTSLFAMNGAAR